VDLKEVELRNMTPKRVVATMDNNSKVLHYNHLGLAMNHSAPPLQLIILQITTKKKKAKLQNSGQHKLTHYMYCLETAEQHQQQYETSRLLRPSHTDQNILAAGEAA